MNFVFFHFFFASLTLRSSRLLESEALCVLLLPPLLVLCAPAPSFGLVRESAFTRGKSKSENSNATMKLAAPLLVAVAAIALSALSSPVSASIHSYDNDYFFSVGDAYIFRGGRVGLYASTKEVRFFYRFVGGERKRERERREVELKMRVVVASGTRGRGGVKNPKLLARGKTA